MQKSEAKDDQSVNDFGAVEPGRCGDRSRADPSQQLLSRIGVAQIGAPPLFDGSADNRQLRHPFRDRNTVVLGLAEKLDDGTNLARALDRDIDERDRENEPDRESDEQRRQDAGLAPWKGESDTEIERPEGDSQNAGPGERGEETVQDPRPDPDQGDRQHDPRDAPRESQAFGLAAIDGVSRIGCAIHRTIAFRGSAPDPWERSFELVGDLVDAEFDACLVLFAARRAGDRRQRRSPRRRS